MAERLVVVGGDAGGMAAAAQARRMRPDLTDLEIIGFERGGRTSFAACGIPYRVAGLVAELDDLVARSPEEHRRRGIDIRVHHDVRAIDLDERTVEVVDLASGRILVEPFDQLLIGTGARPIRPDLPGIESEFVHGVQNLDDAEDLLAHAEDAGCRRVVVVGGGYIGLEMAEAFLMWGAHVTVVEAAGEVMRTLDCDMGALVRQAMQNHGIDVRTGVTVEGFEPGRVLTDHGPIDADLVVLGIGVQPNSELADEAGIKLGVRNSIVVDRRQRTSAEGVWAAGDCCQSIHLVSQQPVHVALGTVANRQARVAGINIGGGYASFPGVIGSAVTKLCATEIGRTGLTDAEAKAAAFDPVSAVIESKTRAGYYPDAAPIHVKVVVERGTGRVLGGQIVGGPGSAKRIDVIAVAITSGMTADELASTDLSYAPPFSPVWDPVLLAAREAAKLA
ncbi:MAG: FAD-dependent oxidoreductase [Acidimicrobiales bacterium]|nr:FAD-dependent oxidoreductase [Acidimicrobiales bacterium]